MGIPHPPMQTLATLIFDGVLDRFPELKWGVIEQGAIWLPSWIRQMESAFEAFARHEDRLQTLSLRPTEFVRRQVRATPYPTEDVGWIIEQSGPEVCLFSSDFPHVEGGRKPVERFQASLDAAGTDEDARQPLLVRQLPRPHGHRRGAPRRRRRAPQGGEHRRRAVTRIAQARRRLLGSRPAAEVRPPADDDRADRERRGLGTSTIRSGPS